MARAIKLTVGVRMTAYCKSGRISPDIVLDIDGRRTAVFYDGWYFHSDKYDADAEKSIRSFGSAIDFPTSTRME
jgi:G:T-mismatch repair DNA endonuclease (very short patch repair protein)